MVAQGKFQTTKRPSVKVQRAALEASLETMLTAVQAVIDQLDALDGDPDLEPSSGAADQFRRYGGQLLDVEDLEHDGREPPEDDEPELGEPERADQRQWGTISPNFGWAPMDGEPYLSASEGLDQRGWASGDRRDLEEACEDEGGQCDDEGCDSDREPDAGQMCNWQDEGDQTTLRSLPVTTKHKTPKTIKGDVHV